MIEKKYKEIATILFILIALSLFIPVNSPTGYVAKDPSTNLMPTCKGTLDYSKLDTGDFKGCNAYKTEFSNAIQTNGITEVDILMFYAIAFKESSCMNGDKLKAIGSSVWSGGLMQVDDPCLCSGKKFDKYLDCYDNYGGQWQCSSVDSQINWGVIKFKESYEFIKSKGIDSMDALTLVLFGYNRGEYAMKFAVNKMDEHDNDVTLAMMEGCEKYYKGTARFDSKGNDMCEYKGYGVNYPPVVLKKFEEACTIAGGTVENLEIPDTVTSLSKTTGIFFKKSIISRIIGNFKMNPSFEVKEQFDFSVYDNIEEELKEISKDCGAVDNKRECVENFLNTPTKNIVKLKIGPQDESKAELLNTVEQIDLCSKTLQPNTNCLCNISINKTGQLNEVYEDLKITFHSTSNNIIFQYEEDEFVINYDDRFKNLNPVITPTKSFKPIMKKLPIDKSYFYMGLKEENNKQKLFLSEDNTNNLPICNFDQKYYVFSTKTNKEFMYYEDEWEYKIGAPDIEFAYYLKEDLIEPEKIWFNVENLDFSENKLLLRIKEGQEKDIEDYYIFYSLNPFLDKAKDVLSPGYFGEIKNYSILKGSNLEVYDDYEYVPAKCEELIEATQVQCNLFFKLIDDSGSVEKILETNKIYYFEDKKEYAMILDFSSQDIKNIHLSVIAKDQSGNMFDFKDVTTTSFEVKDLLHPKITFETGPIVKWEDDKVEFDFNNIEVKNIDGSDAKPELEEYWVYQKKSQCNKPILSNKNCYPLKIDKSKKIEIMPFIESDTNKEYCYYILATDLKLPVTQTAYAELLSKDIYYKQNFNLDYTCIPPN